VRDGLVEEVPIFLKSSWLRLFLLLLAPAAAYSQNARFDNMVTGPRGPIANATVAVCTQPANTSTTPCSTLASLVTTAAGGTAAPNPFTTDSLGNYHFYSTPGFYTIQIYGPQIPTPIVMMDMTVGTVLQNLSGQATFTPAAATKGMTMFPVGTVNAGRGSIQAGTTFGPAHMIAQGTPNWRAAWSVEQVSTDTTACDWSLQAIMHVGVGSWTANGPCNAKGALYATAERPATFTSGNVVEAANFVLDYGYFNGGTPVNTPSENLELDTNNHSGADAPDLSSLYTGLTIDSGGPNSPGTAIWLGNSNGIGQWKTGILVSDFASTGISISNTAAPTGTNPAAIRFTPYANTPTFYELLGLNTGATSRVFSVDQTGNAKWNTVGIGGDPTGLANKPLITFGSNADLAMIETDNAAAGGGNWQILSEATGSGGGAGNLCFFNGSRRGCVNGTASGGAAPLTQTIASGTATLATAAIASGACAPAISPSAAGVLATDAITWSFSTDPHTTVGYGASATGSLYILQFPTAGAVNFLVCNSTGASITPGAALVLNWRVTR
jgi:hypothetical protein